MIEFTAVLLQFASQGEKTGWTYIEIPEHIADQLKPDNKKSFRIKGILDNYSFRGMALMSMGEGNFIMALNAAVRKEIKKRKGAVVIVKIEADIDFSIEPPPYLMECFEDEPEALAFFNKLPKGHRDYFIKWIDSAKTEPTKIKRLSQTINALAKGFGYGEMIRMNKNIK